jgi:DNA-binding transcriptional LysR family regulator
MVLGGAGVTLLPELAVPTEARIKELRVRAFAEPADGKKSLYHYANFLVQ